MIRINEEAEQMLWTSWAQKAGVENWQPIAEQYDMELYSFIGDQPMVRLVLREQQHAIEIKVPKKVEEAVKKTGDLLTAAIIKTACKNCGRPMRPTWAKEPDGRVVKYDSLKQACEAYSFKSNNVVKCVKEHRPYKDYLFSYDEIEQEKVTMNSLAGKDIMVQRA